MDKQAQIKIAIGIGLAVTTVGLVYCTFFYRVRAVSEKASSAAVKASPQAGTSPTENQIPNPAVNSERVKNQPDQITRPTTAVDFKNSIASVKEVECEIPSEIEKDTFMEGVLSDADDESDSAWGVGEGEDGKEAAAFEKQAKAFRAIAGELADAGSEKSKVLAARKSVKKCIAKK